MTLCQFRLKQHDILAKNDLLTPNDLSFTSINKRLQKTDCCLKQKLPIETFTSSLRSFTFEKARKR